MIVHLRRVNPLNGDTPSAPFWGHSVSPVLGRSVISAFGASRSVRSVSTTSTTTPRFGGGGRRVPKVPPLIRGRRGAAPSQRHTLWPAIVRKI